MNIIISNSSGKPIYEQIMTQIKQMIMSGELKAGDAPSHAPGCQGASHSVITTKRAYEELARDGFITNVVGKGSFVAETNQELMREENLREIEDRLRGAVNRARVAGVSRKECQEMFDLLWEDEE